MLCILLLAQVPHMISCPIFSISALQSALMLPGLAQQRGCTSAAEPAEDLTSFLCRIRHGLMISLAHW